MKELKGRIHIHIYKNRTAEGLKKSEIIKAFIAEGAYNVGICIEELLDANKISETKIYTKKTARKRGHRDNAKRKFELAYTPIEKPRYKALNLIIKKDAFLDLKNSQVNELVFDRDPANPLIKFIRHSKVRNDYDHVIIRYKVAGKDFLEFDFSSIALKPNPEPEAASKTVYSVNFSR